MALPSKITPDNLRESIVEVRYDSSLNFEVLIGIFFQAFDNNWFYSNRPYQSKATPLPQMQLNVSQEITIRVGSESLLYNDKINIRLLPGAFVFSCLNNYIGWALFQQEIEGALNLITQTGKIEQWNRVGLRYISEYPGQDLADCFNFTFSFSQPEIKSETMAFRSEFVYNNARVILNLSNKVPVALPSGGNNVQVGTEPTSIADIDVIRSDVRTNTLKDLLQIIEECHTYEKELYFGMMKQEFLTTLKPIY